jgi:Zn-dependent protease with chaperone function
MKTIFRLRSVLAAASLLFFCLADRHPPPVVPEAELSAYVSGPDLSANESGCQLDPNYEPVSHTARRQVQALFYDLALAAGKDPDSYSIELMRDRRGYRAINAMTCADSRVIWISVTAWERLSGYEPALALMLAHELGHANHRHPATLKNDQMTTAERKLLSSQSPRQMVEIAADQRAADLMANAGYTASQINRASHYILARGEAEMLSKATVSHPSGRDRINLMTFYLGRKMLPQISR